MRPRDWCVLGFRLIAIYVVVLAIRPLTEGLASVGNLPESGALRFFAQNLVIAGANITIGIVVWKAAPRLGSALIPGDPQATQTSITAPQALTVGFIIAGLFLVISNVTPVIAHAQTLLFPAPPVSGLGASFEETTRRQSMAYLAGSLVEMGAGAMLAVAAARVAARARISPEKH